MLLSASTTHQLKADKASPALTGTPTAPTAAAATDTTQIATTAFVHDAIALDVDLTAIDLNDLADVDTTGLGDGDVLTYDLGTTTWVAAAPAGGPGGSAYWVENHPLTNDGSPNAASDFFDDTTNQSGPTNGLDAQWTRVSAGYTETFAHGRFYLQGTAADLKHCRVITAPSTPYTVTCLVSVEALGTTASNAGLMFRDSGTGAIAFYGLTAQAGLPVIAGYVYSGPGAGTFVGNIFSAIPTRAHPIWLRLTDNGTNHIFSISVSGSTGSAGWTQVHSQSRTASLTTPDQVGLHVNGVDVAATGVFGAFIVS
jgi:hypothetical protein